jgi:hypothetical protein
MGQLTNATVSEARVAKRGESEYGVWELVVVQFNNMPQDYVYFANSKKPAPQVGQVYGYVEYSEQAGKNPKIEMMKLTQGAPTTPVQSSPKTPITLDKSREIGIQVAFKARVDLACALISTGRTDLDKLENVLDTITAWCAKGSIQAYEMTVAPSPVKPIEKEEQPSGMVSPEEVAAMMNEMDGPPA